jgi:hypothetical protein
LFRGPRQIHLGIVGALPAFVAVALTLDHAKYLFAFAGLPSDDLAGRLAFAVSWMRLPGFCLLVGGFVAARRGFVADAIEGTRTSTSRGPEINLRYNQNTVEQLVLACIAWAGLVIRLPTADLLFIPAMAMLFVIGRGTFWIGYLLHPMGRAFGMVLTVVPTTRAWHGGRMMISEGQRPQKTKGGKTR